MKTRNLVIPVLLLGFILSLFLATNLAALNKAGKPQEEPVRIPKEVKSVFEEGIITREARLDIPFTITNHLYLPARENMHSIFFFKVKNADLGFSPIAPAPVPPEKKEEEKEAPLKPKLSPQNFSAIPIFFFRSTGWKKIHLERWSMKSIYQLISRQRVAPMNLIKRNFTQQLILFLQVIIYCLWP